MNQQQTEPRDDAQLPQVIASYAGYLHARTRTAPETTVAGKQAQISVTASGKTLVLAFRRRQREWSLHSTELRRGEHTTAFARGRVLDAVTALLR